MGFLRAKWRARDVPSVSGALVHLWQLHGHLRSGCIIIVVMYVCGATPHSEFQHKPAVYCVILFVVILDCIVTCDCIVTILFGVYLVLWLF